VRISESGSETKRSLLTLDENNQTVANAVITFRDPQQQNMTMVSNCEVTSLEVYRGKQNITKIHHNGFNITNQRDIEVSLSTSVTDNYTLCTVIPITCRLI
jgi:hypothetical protein